MRHLLSIIWFVALGFSCNKSEEITIEELRRQEIEKRVNQFIQNREQSCYDTSMELAIIKADSLLKLQAVKYVEDSLQRPPLPVKPKKNIKPTPQDTVKNQPFLK